MERFGVGRPAIREAMQALASAGVIEIRHGERSRVSLPDTRSAVDRIGETVLHLLQTSPGTLAHLRDARIMFECGMVKIAAERATDADVARLREALDHHRACRGRTTEFIRADMAFHTAIASVSGNSVFEIVSAAMLDWLLHFRSDLLRAPNTEELTLEEHQKLLDAIAVHDPARAERAMMDHLMRADERYRAAEEAARAQQDEATPA